MNEVLSADELISKVWAMHQRLKEAGIESAIRGYVFGRISIVANTGDEWWEIDFDSSGEIQFERFISNGISENAVPELEKLISEITKLNQQ